MGDRYGISIWEIGHQRDIDRDLDMGYGISMWVRYIDLIMYHIDMVILGYRYGIWANDMGDDSRGPCHAPAILCTTPPHVPRF